MKRFRFSNKFVSLISQMLTNCWFTIVFNGHSHGYLKSTQGVRQGDPLSPALFVIAEEALSRGISQLFISGHCRYYHLPWNVMPISHILYADDSIIFSNGGLHSVKHLLKFLRRYEASSG